MVHSCDPGAGGAETSRSLGLTGQPDIADLESDGLLRNHFKNEDDQHLRSDTEHALQFSHIPAHKPTHAHTSTHTHTQV